MAKIKRPEGGPPSHPRGRLRTLTGATCPATSISALAATSATPPFSKLQPHPVFLAAYLSDDKAKAIFNVGYHRRLAAVATATCWTS